MRHSLVAIVFASVCALSITASAEAADKGRHPSAPHKAHPAAKHAKGERVDKAGKADRKGVISVDALKREVDARIASAAPRARSEAAAAGKKAQAARSAQAAQAAQAKQAFDTAAAQIRAKLQVAAADGVITGPEVKSVRESFRLLRVAPVRGATARRAPKPHK
jgi:hypothetical protein